MPIERQVPIRNRGFALVEAVVVTLILVLFLTMLMPMVKHNREGVTRASCASNLRQWAAAVNAFGGDHGSRLPNRLLNNNDDRPMFHPNVEDPNSPHHEEWVGFYENYLVPYDWGHLLDGGEIVQYCPAGWTSHRWPDQLPVSIGYNFLPGAYAEGTSPDRYTDRVLPWVQKRRIDGPYAHAPIMSDIYMSDEDGNVAGSVGDAAAQWNNHVSSGNPDTVLGSNFLFEEGRVTWFSPEDIEPAYDVSWAWPVAHFINFDISERLKPE